MMRRGGWIFRRKKRTKASGNEMMKMKRESVFISYSIRRIQCKRANKVLSVKNPGMTKLESSVKGEIAALRLNSIMLELEVRDGSKSFNTLWHMELCMITHSLEVRISWSIMMNNSYGLEIDDEL